MIYTFLINLVNPLGMGRIYWFLPSLFDVFLVLSILLSIDEWLPHLKYVQKLSCVADVLSLLGQPVFSVHHKS